MYNELERTGKKADVTYFTVMFCHNRQTSENHKKPYSRLSGPPIKIQMGYLQNTYEDSLSVN
jgi:hypothetical protein